MEHTGENRQLASAENVAGDKEAHLVLRARSGEADAWEALMR